jgi:hypothetical protein
MKIISSKVHGILDYLVVIFLAVSPALFKMEGSLATFTYIVAGAGFLLTIITAFEAGLIKLIPFRIHGLLEFALALGLTGAAFWYNFNNNDLGFFFYLGVAIGILLFFLLTDFGTAKRNR